jgi:hypothetical protein
MNYFYQIILMFLIIINLFIIIFLDYKYKIFSKKNLIDIILDPSYWIWISIYKYIKDTENISTSNLIKIIFSMIYYFYIISLVLRMLSYAIFIIIIIIILIHLINYIVIKKYLKYLNIILRKNIIDYFIPYYWISIAYYLFDKNIKNKSNYKFLYEFSRYIFSLNFFYIVYIIFTLLKEN